ncbi:MAG: N-acetylmuramoyl-L-alanine amidase [Alphaproteobacteria bacterium]|nr:N-acetylmuramoyl-L-alanine amidase [Alphaproteobacteria bacterium]MBF0393302.1 N-acetylmuramoyl-L-alanine amidase [Alphaproteobacteria bacterium]
MLRRLVSVLAALALWVAPSTTARAEGALMVTGVRAGIHTAMTRVVIDLSARMDYRVQTLTDPHRVVIDLPELEWSAPDRLAKPVGRVTGYRWARVKPGAGRLTIGTSGPVEVRQSFLMPPSEGLSWRLVVDLADSGRDDRPKTVPVAVAAPPKPPPQAEKPRPIKPSSRPVVVIDPGHGGVDPGAIGIEGTFEKHLTLQVARAAKQELEKSGRYTVLLTRERDIFIPLRDRVAFARDREADLFISLHADAVPRADIRGLSVYTLSQNASDAEAQALAEKENKADLIGGVDFSGNSPEVTTILIELAQRETMNLSAGFAQDVLDEMAHAIKLLNNSHRFAGFAVLKAPDVPSILVEMGYLSNVQEEQMLRKPEHRAKLASSLARAIERYFAGQQKAKRP